MSIEVTEYGPDVPRYPIGIRAADPDESLEAPPAVVRPNCA